MISRLVQRRVCWVLSIVTGGVVSIALLNGCSVSEDQKRVEVQGGSLEHPDIGWLRQLDAAVAVGRNDSNLLTRSLQHPNSSVRQEGARAVAILQPPDGVSLLSSLLGTETDFSVRETAIYSLGLLHRAEAISILEELLAADPDPRIRRQAAVALGRIQGENVGGRAVAALIAALSDSDASVRGGAALAVWHHGDAAIAAIPRLVEQLQDRDDEVRWRVTYALSRIDSPEKHEALRVHLTDSHPWVRTFSARGLRYPPDPRAVSPLRRLLVDRESSSTARVEALHTLGSLREIYPELNEPIRDVLLEQLVREEHPGASRVLIEALAVNGGEIEATFLVTAIDRADSPTARHAAIRALGRVKLPATETERVIAALEELGESPDPWTRAAVATALGGIGAIAGPPLVAMLRDSDPRVRATAAESVARLEAPFRWPLLRSLATDPDVAVRSTVIAAFAKEKPEGWVDLMVETWSRSRAPEFWELRNEILNALAEDAPQFAREFALEGLRDRFLTVRLNAAKILECLPLGLADAPAPLGLPYPRLDDRFAVDAPLRALIETDRGTLVLELDLEAAPRHVSSFVALAEAGVYDDLLFHRVVPSFVVQGADPRGDGWGDAGYHLVDEFHPSEYVRGTVGMPRAGHHTGGAQLFITHLPTPHLDGRYTIFGQVIEGFEVIDRIEVGDKIRSVQIDGKKQTRAAF